MDHCHHKHPEVLLAGHGSCTWLRAYTLPDQHACCCSDSMQNMQSAKRVQHQSTWHHVTCNELPGWTSGNVSMQACHAPAVGCNSPPCQISTSAAARTDQEVQSRCSSTPVWHTAACNGLQGLDHWHHENVNVHLAGMPGSCTRLQLLTLPHQYICCC